MRTLKTITLTVLILLTVQLMAQDKSQRPSPPAQATASIDGIDVTIDYSQPALKGRDFGSSSFHPYGKIWRNGANENTWIEISGDIKINDKKLAKGKYSFYVIPGDTEWTFIFNSKSDYWGATNPDESLDVLRVSATAGKSSSATERYTIKLDDSGSGSLNWGDWTVSFTIAAD